MVNISTGKKTTPNDCYANIQTVGQPIRRFVFLFMRDMQEPLFVPELPDALLCRPVFVILDEDGWAD